MKLDKKIMLSRNFVLLTSTIYDAMVTKYCKEWIIFVFHCLLLILRNFSIWQAPNNEYFGPWHNVLLNEGDFWGISLSLMAFKRNVLNLFLHFFLNCTCFSNNSYRYNYQLNVLKNADCFMAKEELCNRHVT